MLKFSVIVPFYHVPDAYFRQCLDSILSQTYRYFELILISDGADESTLAISREYEKKDDRIRVVEQVNQGVSAARNHGIDVSVGEWIMFVDADDWIEQDTLEKFNLYVRQSGADYIFGGFHKEFSNKHVDVFSKRYCKKKIFEGEKGQIELLRMTLASPMYGDSGMRATMYRSVCGGVFYSPLLKDNRIRFDQGIQQDEDFLFRVYVAGKSKLSLYVEEMVYHYRNYGDSASIRFREDALGNMQKTAELLKKHLVAENLMDVLADDYNYRIIEIGNSLGVNYFFHCDNRRSMKEKKTIARDFFDSPFFKNAVPKDLFKKLPVKRKVQVLLLRFHLYSLYQLLYVGYNAVMQRKKFDLQSSQFTENTESR